MSDGKQQHEFSPITALVTFDTCKRRQSRFGISETKGSAGAQDFSSYRLDAMQVRQAALKTSRTKCD